MTTTATTTSSRQLSSFVSRHFGVLSISVVFVVLFAVFSVQADAFLTVENQVNVLRQIAPTVIVAMAMTFVITTGQIDLSVGSVLGLSAALLGMWAATGSPVLALVGTLVVGLVVGLVNGALAAYGRMQSFIVTLAALTAFRGLALFLTEGYSTPIESTFLLPLGQGKLLGLYTPTWIAIACVALAWYVFNHTRFGRYVIAVGSNAESLRRSGVDIRKIQMGVLAMAGLAAALAGVITAARLASGSPNSGTAFELEVITAVVLGGTSLMGGRGSVIGSAIGALTLGIISNGLVLLRVDVYWVPIVQGLILVLAILMNTRLFGRFSGAKK
ncbi:ABC transporter permease [Ornithinimicrobium humiphilum]|uniref:Monosaccharide ABC transporter membrane protein (CUT2 family) n=1 Tax=Ornithinimicrobium humiphilum TaxID=125288 RepID=A0A543KRE8_9MICO|nr:ABC transporter permease [Ornithinimicrobium humiphilum]TQM97655.1 monosaccharide ABC transporter membrane protein (CUT2 family) [Ornithinimicrobium humiphilum]